MNNESMEGILLGDAPVSFDEAAERKSFSRLGFGFALFSLVTLVVALAIQVIVRLVSPSLLGNVTFLNLVSPVSMYIFALPVLLLVLSGMRAEPPRKRRMGFWKWTLFLMVGFGFMYIGNYIGQGVMFGISTVVGYDYSNALNSLMEGQSLLLTFIFMVIIAPVGEEIVFRKLLIDRTQKYGGFVSVLLSGLVFGLMHGNFYQVFYAFALGLLLGYVYYSTGKLHLTIAIHAVINFVGSIVAKTLTDAISSMNSDMEAMSETEEELISFIANHGFTVIFMLAFLFFILAAMVCAIVLPIVFRKKLTLGKGETEIPKGKFGSVVFLNVGIIVMLVVYLFEFVLNLIPV